MGRGKEGPTLTLPGLRDTWLWRLEPDSGPLPQGQPPQPPRFRGNQSPQARLGTPHPTPATGKGVCPCHKSRWEDTIISAAPGGCQPGCDIHDPRRVRVITNLGVLCPAHFWYKSGRFENREAGVSALSWPLKLEGASPAIDPEEASSRAGASNRVPRLPWQDPPTLAGRCAQGSVPGAPPPQRPAHLLGPCELSV